MKSAKLMHDWNSLTGRRAILKVSGNWDMEICRGSVVEEILLTRRQLKYFALPCHEMLICDSSTETHVPH